MRIDSAQKLKTFALFRQIGIIGNQTFKSIAINIIARFFDLVYQSKINPVRKSSPGKIGVINKTVKNVFTALK
jgi:hypothetical protein